MQEDNIWESSRPGLNSGQAELNKPFMMSNNKSLPMDLNFRRIISVWPFVLLLGILGYFGGKFVIRYARILYTVSTSINIEQKEEVTIGQALFPSSRDPFNDQIAFFKSPAFAMQIVDSLGLNYHADAKGTLKDKDFYGKIRWKIIPNPGTQQLPLLNFELTASKSGFTLKTKEGDHSGVWGQPIQVNQISVVIEKLSDFSGVQQISCRNTDRLEEAFSLSGRLAIASNKESNVIQISYSDYSGSKAIDILNEINKVYNTILVQDKTRSLTQAIDFIEKRLSPLSHELDSIENSIAVYKSLNGFVGTSANGELYLAQIKEYDRQLNDAAIQQEIINSVEKFIENPLLKDENMALIGIGDAYLQSNVSEYHLLWGEREKLLQTLNVAHPNVKAINDKIAIVKNNLILQLGNYRKNLEFARTNFLRNRSYTSELLQKTPEAERTLLGKFRLQQIKETLFLSLLQKREEAAISRASVAVKSRILVPPVLSSAIRKPDPSKIVYTAVVIGALLPLLIVFIREVLNKKIVSKKQIQRLSSVPVIAELELVSGIKERAFVIDNHSRSMIGEQLRSLRTSLDFYRKGVTGNSMVVLITSSMSGEGKSFLSLNLAKSYAMQGKRVALLEFDLRRPKISRKFIGQGNSLGLSDVLIGRCGWKQIVVPLEEREGERLDIFPAGKIPPNPQELISGTYTPGFIAELLNNYDVVIFDTPPFGIVADAQILSQWADITLVVARFGLTINEQIRELEEWNRKSLFKSMGIVFNGIKRKGYFGYKYGYYYYKSKYGNSYYTSDTSKG